MSAIFGLRSHNLTGAALIRDGKIISEINEKRPDIIKNSHSFPEKSILITGINGFVGAHLQAFLLKKSYDVYGIGRHFNNENISKVDVTNKKKVFNIIKNVKPMKIFHLAAQSSVEKSWISPKLTERVNVEGTKNVFDSCIKAKINPKILVVSSSEVYGRQIKFPITEESELKPLSPYAESRIKQEELSMNYFERYNLGIVIARSFSHTGPGQNPSFVCSGIAKQIAEIEIGIKRPIIEIGNLNAVRDFSDVRDIIAAYDLALEKCKFGEIYNICSSKCYKIGDILGTLLKMSWIDAKIKIDKKKIRENDVPFVQGDNSKFCKETKWKPAITLKRTLKDLLEFWRERIK